LLYIIVDEEVLINDEAFGGEAFAAKLVSIRAAINEVRGRRWPESRPSTCCPVGA